MYCPQCAGEFVDSLTNCPDCRCPLTAELANPAPSRNPPRGFLEPSNLLRWWMWITLAQLLVTPLLTAYQWGPKSVLQQRWHLFESILRSGKLLHTGIAAAALVLVIVSLVGFALRRPWARVTAMSFFAIAVVRSLPTIVRSFHRVLALIFPPENVFFFPNDPTAY
jgi:hypothetical protein